MTGVIPLPAANSRKSPSSERGLNVPARRQQVEARSRRAPGRRSSSTRTRLGPLDRDGGPVSASCGRARQRVAPRHRTTPLRRHPHRDELPRLSRKTPRPAPRRDGRAPASTRRPSRGSPRPPAPGSTRGSRRCYLERRCTSRRGHSSRPPSPRRRCCPAGCAHPRPARWDGPADTAAENSSARPHRRSAPLHRGVLRAELGGQHASAAPPALDRAGRRPAARPGIGQPISLTGEVGRHLRLPARHRAGGVDLELEPRGHVRRRRRPRPGRTARTSGAAGRPGRPRRTAAGCRSGSCAARSRRPAGSRARRSRQNLAATRAAWASDRPGGCSHDRAPLQQERGRRDRVVAVDQDALDRPCRGSRASR